MPTGYTADIEKGITFTEYALTCARAFGACVAMRDDPLSGDIPEFKVSDYHAKALKKECEALKEFTNYSLEAAERKAHEAYDEEVAGIAKHIAEHDALRTKYNDMLATTKEWSAPTGEHVELRAFMIKQIEDSIEFDCDTSYYKNTKVEKMSGEVWRANNLARIAKSIEYHTRELEKETASVAKRNQWVTDLKSSLPS